MGERTDNRPARGFSMVEMLVATAASLVVLAAGVLLFHRAMDVGYLVTQRAEMQNNARVAVNMLARDIATAATGMPAGGVQLPSGAGATLAKFACDPAGCYVVNNVYPQARLYALNPGDGLGPAIGGVATDTVTLVYRDSSYALDQYPLVSLNAAGTDIQVDALTSPAINDPAAGITAGDVLVLSNVNGAAAGVVTATDPASGHISLAAGDPLNINQPSAAFGNIASLASPAGSGSYPQTRAFRVLVITYYIDAATQADSPRLMRQAGAHAPVPAAENIENLQITYDTFDDNTAVLTANLPGAGGAPNQIRKVNISIGSRAHFQKLIGRGLDHVTLGTSVGTRNLSFRDRYQ